MSRCPQEQVLLEDSWIELNQITTTAEAPPPRFIGEVSIYQVKTGHKALQKEHLNASPLLASGYFSATRAYFVKCTPALGNRIKFSAARHCILQVNFLHDSRTRFKDLYSGLRQ